MNEEEQIEKTLDKLAQVDLARGNPYTTGRLFGVATLGAVSSLVLYAIYQSLDPDYRQGLQKNAIGAAKAQARAWFSEE